jgi:hypothetical protein
MLNEDCEKREIYYCQNCGIQLTHYICDKNNVNFCQECEEQNGSIFNCKLCDTDNNNFSKSKI